MKRNRLSDVDGMDDSYRKRQAVDVDGSPNCSSWEAASDDDDGGEDQSELRLHEENLDMFCVNIGMFLNQFQDRVVTMTMAGEFDSATLNANLAALSNEIAVVLRSRENRPRIADAHAAHNHAADTKRWLDARELSVNALYDRVFGCS